MSVAKLEAFDNAVTLFLSNRSYPAYLELFIWPGARLFGWEGMLLLWPPVIYYLSGTTGLIFFLSSAAIGQSVNRLIKQTAQRDRPTPPSPLPERHFFVKVPTKHGSSDGPSFPSGDSMACGSVAATLYVLLGNKLYLLLALWGMIGRMYYHCHYFFDTVVGASIGVASALVVKQVPALSPTGFICAIPIFIAWMKCSKVVARYIHVRNVKM
jgi:membrane-associated phospholipid phosphatase|tara:strand:- start:130 stop:765 length:636 start_codon:yes stop_codon:yes gene_type:complete